MLIPDRLQRIRELLARDGSVRIDDLVRDLGVSAWTVRRDLAELERLGQARRAHGGAVLDGNIGADGAVGVASEPGEASGSTVKARIATAANEHIADGSTIMLVSGSTTSALTPLLTRRRLTVVTNGLETAWALRNAPNVSLVVLGGYLHHEQLTLLGPLSEGAMADLHVDLIVAGAYGVHPTVGVTGSKVVQAGAHHHMLRHSDGLLVLADASKLGRRGTTVLASIDDVTTLITDGAADSSELAALRAAGLDVEVAAG